MDERAWLNADPRKAAENLRAVVGAGEQPGGRCYCRHDYHDTDCPEGWPEEDRPAPVVPDSADVRGRVIEQVRLSRIADQAWQNRRSDAEFQDEAERLADAVLVVAAPIIERETGERVAREIERLRDALTDDPDRAALELLIEDAARIARGEGS